MIVDYLKDAKDSLTKFVEDNSFDKADSETDLICLKADLKAKDFLLIITSKSLLSNVTKQNDANGFNFFFVDATYKKSY